MDNENNQINLDLHSNNISENLNTPSKSHKKKLKSKIKRNDPFPPIKTSSVNYSSTEPTIKKIPNIIGKYDLIYSPRTTFYHNKKYNDDLYNDLSNSFDPITLKILKTNFKEKLGKITKIDFINNIRNNLINFHPELPNRKSVIIKLLSRLFDEVDLNNNHFLEWNEFTNYILQHTNSNSNNKLKYSLKMYSNANTNIDIKKFNGNFISYSFYIEKHNLIGMVEDGKSLIRFFDAKTCKELKCSIDVRETQKEIDKLEILELDIKAKEKLLEIEERKKKDNNNNSNKKKLLIKKETLRQSIILSEEKVSLPDSKQEKLKAAYKLLTKSTDNNNLNNNENKIFNKKLTILTTEFINEYDLLLVSSTNNKISAWRYIQNDFKNVNSLKNIGIDAFNFNIAILSSYLPQYTLTWDPINKCLFSGQADGKILKWSLFKSKNIESETLSYLEAKQKHDSIYKTPSAIRSETIRNTIRKKTMTLNMNENKDNNKGIQKGGGAGNKEEEFKEQNKKLLSDIKFDMGRDTVSVILILDKIELLAAGYYNGHVLLWDTLLKTYRKFYTDQETGIYEMTFNSNKNLLFTCGFDHNVFVYDPYIDGSAIYKLTGHLWSINSICCNDNDNEIISLDILGNIKIWDSETFYNFQTINLNDTFDDKRVQNDIHNSKTKKISSNLKMIFLNKDKKILVYGNEKISMFEKENFLHPNICDDSIVLGSIYNELQYEIFCVCLKKIKFFSILNGKCTKIFENIISGEITAFDCDSSNKKIYIGDNYGKIININLFNGTLIKNFQSHTFSKEIISLIKFNNYLISFGNDSIIKIHSDFTLNDTNILKEIDLNLSTNIIKLNVIEVNSFSHRLIFGLENGLTKFFDLKLLRFDGEINNTYEENNYLNDNISKIIDIKNLPIIFICHNSGKCKFMLIPPSENKGKIFAEFLHKNSKIISGCIYNNILLCGDNIGNVINYDISEIYNFFNNDNNNIDNIDNIKININYNYNVEKYSIIHISIPNISPNIFIFTCNNRKVKIYDLNKGTFIDDLKQVANKFIEIPTGIKYYVSDPFLTRIDEDNNNNDNNNINNNNIKTGIITRADVSVPNYKTNLTKLKNEYAHLEKYNEVVTINNIKDKLRKIIKVGNNIMNNIYLNTNNNYNLDDNKSINWNFYLDFDYLEKKKTKEYENILIEINKLNQNFLDYKEYKNIFNDEYNPTFLNDYNEEDIKNFENDLNSKIRNVKLAQNKKEIEDAKYNSFKKENKRNKNVNLKNVIKMLNLNNSNNNLHIKDKFEEKRKEIYGNVKRKINGANDLFSYYKTDVDIELKNLKNCINYKIKRDLIYPLRLSALTGRKENKLILPRINRSLNLNEFKLNENNIIIDDNNNNEKINE